MSDEKGAKRCDSRPFCTVIASNQLIIGRKEHEIIMKIGAYCRNRRPICPIRPNVPVAIPAVPTSATAASTARGIAKNGVTTLSAAARGYHMANPAASPVVSSTVGLKNMVIAPLTADTEGTLTYGELQLVAGAIEASITPQNADPDVQYFDDVRSVA